MPSLNTTDEETEEKGGGGAGKKKYTKVTLVLSLQRWGELWEGVIQSPLLC